MTQTIIALDFPSQKKTLEFLDIFDEPLFVKIGLELFYHGFDIVEKIKEKEHKIFLDLKLHDIPNTVKGAMQSLSKLEVDMVDVHCLGGNNMLKAAMEGLTCKKTLCVGITQLTSSSESMIQGELGIKTDLETSVLNLSQNAKNSGLQGVVCSVHEVKKIHKFCGKDFLTITPGIRLASDENNDQTRVATPRYAKEQGSDFIVVGRSITKSKDPYETYKKIQSELM